MQLHYGGKKVQCLWSCKSVFLWLTMESFCCWLFSILKLIKVLITLLLGFWKIFPRKLLIFFRYKDFKLVWIKAQKCLTLLHVNICNSTPNNLLSYLGLLIIKPHFCTSLMLKTIRHTQYFTRSIEFNVKLCGFCMMNTKPTSISLFKVNNRNKEHCAKSIQN